MSILSHSSSRALGTIISKHFSIDGFAPVMDYAVEVWGTKNYDQCNTAQHRAMRTFLGVTPVAAMYGDLQWYTPFTHQDSMIWCWLCMTRMPKSHLAKGILLWGHENALSGMMNWDSDILNKFTKCNLQQHFPRSHWPGLAPYPIIHGSKWLLLRKEC